mmetsp:Transcript_34043/g.68573  ORF Transcript_34043/g.68573 Transcript_34043/m.68573 type:complete len:228 (+) Transcript_34043:56-739(+)
MSCTYEYVVTTNHHHHHSTSPNRTADHEHKWHNQSHIQSEAMILSSGSCVAILLTIAAAAQFALSASFVSAFSVVTNSVGRISRIATATAPPFVGAAAISHRVHVAPSSSSVALKMSDSGGGGSGARQKSTKKGLKTITIEKTEQKQEEEEKKEEMWRVILHNDEINTFQHVTRAITKVITTLDRKRAFDICMETHGIGKATLSKTVSIMLYHGSVAVGYKSSMQVQ